MKTNRFLLTSLMFILVIIGEGLPLRSYCLYVFCGIIIIYVLVSMHKNEKMLLVTPELMILAAFLVFSVLSYFWAFDQELVLSRAKVLFFMVVLVFLVTNLFAQEGEYDRFIGLYWMMGLLLSTLCLVRFGISGIKNIIVSGLRLGKDEAFFLGINPNTIGMDCAFAGVITFYYFFIKGKKAVLWALLPITIVVLASGSRKGLFVLLFGLLLILFFLQMQKEKATLSMLFRIVLIAAGIIAAVNLVLQFPGMEKAKEQYMGLINFVIGNEKEADVSTRIRGNMVKVGWEQFLRTPLFGIGLDNAKIINLKYNNFDGYLHNNYIELLADEGLAGFIIYYLFYAAVFAKHIHRLNEKNPLIYISFTLLILRLITDWGRISYFDYINIPLFSFWIAVSNKFDLQTEHCPVPKRNCKYLK